MSTKENAFRIFSLIKTEISLLHDSELLKDKIAKNLSLIVVDEVIEQWEYIDTYLADLMGAVNPNLTYWVEVKHEIEKL